MSKLVMNIQNEQNMKAMVEWCKQYHIQYQVIEDKAMPSLVDDTVNTPTKTVSATKSGKDVKNDALKGHDKKAIGDFVEVYPDLCAVRYWELAKFTPDKVKYGIKASLKEAGAKWDDNLKAFTFTTKKSFNAWVKAQKER